MKKEMDLKGKTALVVGLGISGVSAAKLLFRLGAEVLLTDSKGEEKLSDTLAELGSVIQYKFISDANQAALMSDLIVVSPGVPLSLPFLVQAAERNIPVISELELAYSRCRAPIIAITGTNGKTTTTALLGEILKASGRTTHVVGNIGVPFTEKAMDMEGSHTAVVEVSSFQLEGIRNFRPYIAVILNITEDHMDRHKTMENYIAAKARIYENQTKGDILILNADDRVLSGIETDNKGESFYFSRHKVLNKGAWVENGKIVLNIGNGSVPVCSTDQVGIPGSHNLENALAAVLAAGLCGTESETIARVLKEFPGVEHRIEKVAVINGVTYYNDSKGTNPDSSIKAIEAMKGSTILIAGGYDKKSDFTEFVNAFNDKVDALILLGETAGIIAAAAREKGFTNIHMTKTMEEAVEKAYELSSPGQNVLLSPACASWDMFRNYEERGRIFKEAVLALRG
jgi:UDP-N-acetylmuramoylalanine--D-glutamate ligase